MKNKFGVGIMGLGTVGLGTATILQKNKATRLILCCLRTSTASIAYPYLLLLLYLHSVNTIVELSLDMISISPSLVL